MVELGGGRGLNPSEGGPEVDWRLLLSTWTEQRVVEEVVHSNFCKIKPTDSLISCKMQVYLL